MINCLETSKSGKPLLYLDLGNHEEGTISPKPDGKWNSERVSICMGMRSWRVAANTGNVYQSRKEVGKKNPPFSSWITVSFLWHLPAKANGKEEGKN